MKIVAVLISVLTALATFLLLAFTLVWIMSCLRGTMKEAGLLALIFLNALNMAVGFGGLMAVFLLPIFVFRRVLDAIT